MSRYSRQSSYRHNYKRLSYDWYRIYWTVDRYVEGNRLRFPTQYSRDTDEAGMRRFCKKWGLAFSEKVEAI